MLARGACIARYSLCAALVSSRDETQTGRSYCKEACAREFRRFAATSLTPGCSLTVGIYERTKSNDIRLVQRFSLNHGFADVENMVPFTETTLARVASISKSITCCLTAHLSEKNLIAWDVPIRAISALADDESQECPFADATPAQLASHTAGVRAYADRKEFLNQQTFSDLKSSLNTFLKDSQKPPVLPQPYLYSSHGYCLLSYVIDRVAQACKLGDVQCLFRYTFQQAGMHDTYLESHDSLLPGRCRQYHVNERGQLTNGTFVRNEYKFASGGVVSTSSDLEAFGRFMLSASVGLEQFISAESVQKLWTPVCRAKDGLTNGYEYGLGWMLQDNIVFHTGGAAGGSSILVIAPFRDNRDLAVVIAMIFNRDSVKGMFTLARKIVAICNGKIMPNHDL